MGYIVSLKALARNALEPDFWAPCQTFGDSSGATASRVVSQHASAVACGIRVVGPLARTSEKCAGTPQETIEIRSSHPGCAWPLDSSCLGTGSEDQQGVSRANCVVDFAVGPNANRVAGSVLPDLVLTSATETLGSSCTWSTNSANTTEAY